MRTTVSVRVAHVHMHSEKQKGDGGIPNAQPVHVVIAVIAVPINGSQSGLFLRKKADRRRCWWRHPEGGSPECPALSDCASPFMCVWACIQFFIFL